MTFSCHFVVTESPTTPRFIHLNTSIWIFNVFDEYWMENWLERPSASRLRLLILIGLMQRKLVHNNSVIVRRAISIMLGTISSTKLNVQQFMIICHLECWSEIAWYRSERRCENADIVIFPTKCRSNTGTGIVVVDVHHLEDFNRQYECFGCQKLLWHREFYKTGYLYRGCLGINEQPLTAKAECNPRLKFSVMTVANCFRLNVLGLWSWIKITLISYADSTGWHTAVLICLSMKMCWPFKQ